MSPANLLLICVLATARDGDGAQVVLKVQGLASGAKVRLLRTRGPYGVVLGHTPSATIARFNAKKVSKWLHKNGLAWTEIEDGKRTVFKSADGTSLEIEARTWGGSNVEDRANKDDENAIRYRGGS